MHSGQVGDDPEAHFQLATITLLTILHQATPEGATTLARETAAALADCAANAAPYELRDFARLLTQLGIEHQPLGPYMEGSQTILTGKTDAAPGENSG